MLWSRFQILAEGFTRNGSSRISLAQNSRSLALQITVINYGEC